MGAEQRSRGPVVTPPSPDLLPLPMFQDQARILLSGIPPDSRFDKNPWNQDNLTQVLKAVHHMYAKIGGSTEVFASFEDHEFAGSHELVLKLDAIDSSPKENKLAHWDLNIIGIGGALDGMDDDIYDCTYPEFYSGFTREQFLEENHRRDVVLVLVEPRTIFPLK